MGSLRRAREGRARVLAVLAALTLAVTACGTTEEPTTPSNQDTASGPVTVTDARGKSVTLPAPAKRVVGLEWGEIEMLVSLGVMPVGAADLERYATWVTSAKLDGTVKDVGVRGEPSVDAIVALQPDLVVMEADGMETTVEQLERFVPVIVTKGSDASRNLARMREDVTMIATATGRTTEATALLSNLDNAIADGKKKLASAGVAEAGYAMADGWTQGGTVAIRMFGQGALVSDLATALGLRNVWTGPVDKAWGLGQTDVEGLLALKDTNVRFFYNASGEEDVFADGLKNNAIWTSLPFVRNGQVHKLANGIWTFGGPLSCIQYIEQLIKTYAP